MSGKKPTYKELVKELELLKLQEAKLQQSYNVVLYFLKETQSLAKIGHWEYNMVSNTLSGRDSEILIDKTKLIQVLSNLLSNAVKFTKEGRIEFGYSLQNEKLKFYAKDSGIGISQNQQTIIFDRFRQADLSINKDYGGTGLGLSISQGFIYLFGGDIWVESKPKKGSTFFFTIPYCSVNI